jgi:hypothetical protein
VNEPRERRGSLSLAVSVSSLLAIVAAAPPAFAVRSGIDGYTGKNGPTCNACHSGGALPLVTLTGPRSLLAGQVGEYTVRVQTNKPGVGMGGAATDGVTVTPSTNTKQKFAEVCHSAVIAPANGAAEVTFHVEAPPTNGTITVYAVGNAVDNDKHTTGDGASTASLDVTVTGGRNPPPPTADAGAGSPPSLPPAPGSSLPPSSSGSPAGVAPPPSADAGGERAIGQTLPTHAGTSPTEFDDGGSVECAVRAPGRARPAGTASSALACGALFGAAWGLRRTSRRR